MISRAFSYAVAFHGMNEERILIGGVAPDTVKRKSRTPSKRHGQLRHPGRFATTGDDFNGNDQRNIVNQFTARSSTKGKGRIEIEQSLTACKHYGTAIADAVTKVYRPKL